MPLFKSLLTKIRRLVNGEKRCKTTEVNDNNTNDVVENVTPSPESSGVRSGCHQTECPSSLMCQHGRTASASHPPSGFGRSGVGLPGARHTLEPCTISRTLGRDNLVDEQPYGDSGCHFCNGDCAANVARNAVASIHNSERSDPEERITTKSETALSKRVRHGPSACSKDADLLSIRVPSTGAGFYCHDMGTQRDKSNSHDPPSRPSQKTALPEVYHGLIPEAERKEDRNTSVSMDDMSEVVPAALKSGTAGRSIGLSQVTAQQHRGVTRDANTGMLLSDVRPSRQKPKHEILPQAQQSVQKACGQISDNEDEFRTETLQVKPTGGLSSIEIMKISAGYVPECTTVQQTQLFPNNDTEIPVFPARQRLTQKTYPEPKESMQFGNISENPNELRQETSKSKLTEGLGPSKHASDTMGYGSGARPKSVNTTRSIGTSERPKELSSNKSNHTTRYSKEDARMPQHIPPVLTHEVEVTTFTFKGLATPRHSRHHQAHSSGENLARSQMNGNDVGLPNPLIDGRTMYFFNSSHMGAITPAASRMTRSSRPRYPDEYRRGDDPNGKKYRSGYRGEMPRKPMNVEATSIAPNDPTATRTDGVTSDSSAAGMRCNTANTNKTTAVERRNYRTGGKKRTRNRTRQQKEHSVQREANVETDEFLVMGDSNLDSILLKQQKALDKHQEKMTILSTASSEQYENVREHAAQKSEFDSCTGEILFKLIGHDATSTETTVQLRRRFGVECKRLETALPIYARRTDIVEAVRGNAVCIVLGETGSGKSTQLTQYIYEAGAAPGGKIVCTQPRKVAAISLATRVAQELATPLGGDLVGYRVGLQRRERNNTALLYVTDHVLLNQCLRDPLLTAYSCIIIDEAHERSIFTDLLLGMVKRCLDKRDNLRVIITSATIDPELFVRYFGGCPVLKVHGRTYPVDVRYERTYEQPGRGDYLALAVQKVKKIHATEPPGDVLVFVPSALDTQKGCEAMNQLRGIVSQPLHGGLPANEQQKVFDPDIDGRRKIVFATNCAETSVTVPGIKYVVDTGLAKERTYDPKLNVSSLALSVISRSSADQRKGRAGRTAPGTCYRLYSGQCYDDMAPASTPEILRVHIGQAMLKLMDIGVDDPASFDYVESPPPAAMKTAAEALDSLGATNDGRINELGRRLSRLNVQPRLGKVIILAIEAGIGFDGLVATALSTVGGYVFFRGVGNNEQQTADKNKFRLCEESGDVLTFVSLYKQWTAQPERAKNRWCVENSVNAKFMRLARDSVTELKRTLKRELQVDVNEDDEAKEVVDQRLAEILLECYSDNLCFFSGHQRAGYWVASRGGVGADNIHLHPSSALASLGSQPRWIIFENLMVTSRPYMMNVTAINDDLVERYIADGRLGGVDVDALTRQHLLACPLPPVGPSVMRALTGRGFEHLKRLEKEARVRCKTEVLMLDASFSESRLVVYVTQDLLDAATAIIDKRISSEMDRLAAEDLEEVLGASGVTVVLGRGGAITNLLMPDEYRTVVIADVGVGVDVMDTLRKIGLVVNFFRFKSEDRSRRWGKVTFALPGDALRAVNDNGGAFSAKRAGGYVRAGADSAAITLKAQWCRRPTKRFAFVTMANPEDVIRGCCALLIRGRIVDVNVSRKDCMQLYLTNLPPDVDEVDIRTALKRKDDDIDILKVVVPRETVGSTTASELDHLRSILYGQLNERLSTHSHRIEMIPPREKDFHYKARISFSTEADGMTALQELNDHVTVGGRPVSFTADLRTSMSVPKPVYDCIREDLDQVIEMYSRDGSSVEVSKKQGQDCGHVVVWIHSDNLTGLRAAADAVRRVVQPKTVEFESTEEFRCATGPAGREELRRIEADTGAKITVDTRLMNVLVHGPETTRRRATMAVDQFVKDSKTRLKKEVSLGTCGNTVRLMKLLLTKYGLDLEELQRRTGALYLELQLRRHALVFRGTNDAYETLKRALQEDEAQLTDERTTTPSDDSPDCPVCFCPVDEGDIYRLEYCGHAYCRPCIGALLQQKCRDAELPAACVQEDCGEAVVLRDLTNLLGYSPEAKSRWHRAAVESLVKTNPGQYHYCTTPDCPTVYRAATSQDDGARFRCRQCSAVTCTACHASYHDGVTCAAYKAMKRDGNVDITTWLNGDVANRALCPSCKTPMEKDGGCNHMHCTACHVHICWKCKATFETATATYDHLSHDHGGIFEFM